MTTTAIDDVLSSSAAALAPTPSTQTARAKKRGLAFRLLPLLTAAALGIGTLGFIAGHGKETTDDAQIESHVASVSPRVSGQVARVLVQDNQRVQAGDVLVELDPRDFDVRLSSVANSSMVNDFAWSSVTIRPRVVSSSCFVSMSGSGMRLRLLVAAHTNVG